MQILVDTTVAERPATPADVPVVFDNARIFARYCVAPRAGAS